MNNVSGININPNNAQTSGMTWLKENSFIIIAFSAWFENVIGVTYDTKFIKSGIISGGKNACEIKKDGMTTNGTITKACCIVLTLDEIQRPIEIAAQVNKNKINITE